MTDAHQTAAGGKFVAGAGGVLGPLAVVGIAFVTLRALAGEQQPMVLVPASCFFGLMAFDLIVSAGFAMNRHRGHWARNYSTSAAFGVILLPIWLVVAVAVADNTGTWVASPVAVVVVGMSCLTVQVVIVGRLNRLGRSIPPT